MATVPDAAWMQRQCCVDSSAPTTDVCATLWLRSRLRLLGRVFRRRDPPQNIQPVCRRIRRQEIRDGMCRPSGSTEKFDGPFRDPRFALMNVLARLRFVDVFALQHQGERRLGANECLGVCRGLVVGGERIVIVSAITLVWRAKFRMTPDPVLKDRIPDIAAAGECTGGVGSDLLGIVGRWIGHGMFSLTVFSATDLPGMARSRGYRTGPRERKSMVINP